MRRRVLFIANSLDNAYKFKEALSGLDVEIAAGSTHRIEALSAPDLYVDLIVFEAYDAAASYLEEVELVAMKRACPLLVIVDEMDLSKLRLPAKIPSDFVTSGASAAECKVRALRLLGDAELNDSSEIIVYGDMVVNLATYQVTVAGEPVDFTYQEYALLSYLAQHPDHTFSRDMLLQNVWDFDYYGGSRTVDVHVRRIRAKLGPDMANHLQTVRGVGYYWDSRRGDATN